MRASSNIVVHKYGGSSVATVDRIQLVAQHIANEVGRNLKLVVAVSAMGEYTDELIAMAQKITQKPPLREMDMLLTAGERVSMALLSISLSKLKIPSISLTGSQSGILTDETHGNAKILKISGERIRDGLKTHDVVIVAGFQGVSPRTKEITTLGRGGTDLTAVAIAAHLNAPCEIYKDVDGVMTADPRIVRDARVMPSLSWDEMGELTWGGSGVLHSRCVNVATKFKVPVTVRSSFNLDSKGTLLSDGVRMEEFKISGISQRRDLSLLTLAFKNLDEANRASSLVSAWLWEQGEISQINIIHISHERAMLNVSISEKYVADVLAHIKTDLEFAAETVENLSSITLVGHGFYQSPREVSSARNIVKGDVIFSDVRTNAMTFLVRPESTQVLVNRLHHEFLRS